MKPSRLICLLILFAICLVPLAAAYSYAGEYDAAPGSMLVSDEMDNEISLPNAPSWWFSGSEVGSEVGGCVASAGDVDGDGYDDVIVGAPKFTVDIYRGGGAMVFRGSTSGLSSTPVWVVGGSVQGSLYGTSVGSAGDLNGDTYDDVFVTASHHKETEADEGAIFIYSGSENGLETDPTWTYYGGQKDAEFGYSAANAGDVNDDGHPDLIVGAQHYTQNLDMEGAVFVFFGSGNGFGHTPDQVFYGGDTNAQFGFSVSSAGDLNNDGYADVIVGAPNYTHQSIDVGAVFIYFGSENGLEPASINPITGPQISARFGAAVSDAGDVNGDHYDDVIVGAPMYDGNLEREGAVYIYYGAITGVSNLPNWAMTGGQAYAFYGTSVSSAGNLNNDVFSEFLVGANRYGVDQSEEGRVFLYEGTQTGPNSVSVWTAEGNKAETAFGTSVSLAGDVDGDGFGDVIVGAPTYRVNHTIVGRAYAYYGSGSVLTETFMQYLPLLILMNEPTR